MGDGHEAWKVGARMFAVIGMMDTGVSVKCADVKTAGVLTEMGPAVWALYFHRSWVQMPWGAASEDELCERLRRSYRFILG